MTSPSVPQYDHVVVVVEENHTPAEIEANAPYIDSLIQNGAALTNETAVGHPSQPNYLALYAGSDYGIADDNVYSLSGPTLATQLAAAGKSFIGYVDGGSPQKHNPWEAFGDNVEAPMSSFPQGDFASLPAVSFVVPNLNHDMHDGSVQQADGWLQDNLGAYASWAQTHSSLLIVTTDEDDGSGDNHVLTVIDGANIVQGSYNEAASPVTLDATIAAAAGVTPPGPAANVAPLTDMFNPASPADDTLVMDLSEDAYQGDAQAQLFIDGQAFGSPLTVTASHAAGQLQQFDISLASVPAGTHTIGVQFINDLYGGTPSTDRNLFVSPIQVGALSGSSLTNPTAYGSGIQALWTTGDTATFSNVLISH